MAANPDRPTLRATWRNIRGARAVHGAWRNRAVWALTVYHCGRWVLGMRATPMRWVGNKVYGFAMIFTPMITGVSLDRHTRIGEKFHIIHPGMVLIHPEVRIGDRCGIMHGVTLGTSPSNPGVPVVGDDVFIGAAATVLGGVRIGDGAKIAANSLVICDVPAGATAIGVPAKVYPSMGASLGVGPLAGAKAHVAGGNGQSGGVARQRDGVELPAIKIG
ncbi:MAG TPA: serine acetyltransferase [Phycisphaerae bacterium]|nr:serine acetyltransferase [Phycisphaerae bacterium]